jgi:hypothetical protein
MADPRDVIHQIEYRWQHEKDMSPFATTMPQSMTAGWDDLIRAWVRHPHASRLLESMCYKTWDDTGDAALAWRYRDPRAAESAAGTSGRPQVSRVLVGHASLLTPEVAIAFCITGLPSFIRPDRVSASYELPTVGPDELTTLVNKAAAEHDQEAAQQAGLPELVAAALSDRDRPLAIYLPEELIVRRLTESPQGRLLWGLHRIMCAVPGTDRRGWSFSSFELPLGAQDVATLPDIVFRQAVEASAPPGIVRDELKVWPLDPDALADLHPQDVRTARRLVEAYAAHGVDGVQRLIAEEARGDIRALLGKRQGRRHDDIADDPGPQPARKASAAPQPVSSERAPIESAPSGPVVSEPSQRTARPDVQETEPAAPTVPPTPPWPAVAAGISALPYLSQDPVNRSVTAPPGRPEQGQHAAQPRPWEESAGRHQREGGPLVSSREGQSAPPLSLPDPQPQPRQAPPDYLQPGGDLPGQVGQWGAGRIDYLLRQMREAPNPSALHETLRLIVEHRADLARSDRPEARDERQEARRILSFDDWYDSVAENSGCELDARELARIFQIIVIPDLGKAEDVTERIGGWADSADPQMVCGLLMAAHDAALKERTKLMSRKSKKDPVEYVWQIMRPRLAMRWVRENGIAQRWDPGALQ